VLDLNQLLRFRTMKVWLDDRSELNPLSLTA
jgi:hypothetical protein